MFVFTHNEAAIRCAAIFKRHIKISRKNASAMSVISDCLYRPFGRLKANRRITYFSASTRK